MLRGTLRGVSVAPQPQSFYDAVGGEPTFRQIARRFYEVVEQDELMRPLYPEELEPAEERMRLFLIQQWGGPTHYTTLRGPAKLGARHLRFKIARPHRDAWLRAMRTALDEAPLTPEQREQMWFALENLAWNMTTHASPSKPRNG